jgi:hypothetical protein
LKNRDIFTAHSQRKNMLNRKVLMATAVMVAGLPSSAYAADLLGAKASVGVYCCTAPIESNRRSNIATATVGDGVEFPQGSLASGGGLFSVIPVAIDVGATSIDLDYTTSSLAASGSFNGYVFSFTDGPKITGVSVNGLSTFKPVDLSFTDNSVSINVASLSFTPSSRLRLSLALAPGQDPPTTSVPESSPAVLPLFGLLALGVMVSKQAKGRSTERLTERLTERPAVSEAIG